MFNFHRGKMRNQKQIEEQLSAQLLAKIISTSSVVPIKGAPSVLAI